jgi:predicted metal-dependent phosphoesterase TrpH
MARSHPRRWCRSPRAQGVRCLAVTDHDTTGAVQAAARAARPHGLEIVPGIEISAWLGHEIHILGLFVDPDDATLAQVMAGRAIQRQERVREIAARLAALGCPVDAEAIVAEAGGRAANVGRPHVARALVAAGHVGHAEEAFRRFLGRDAPAYVPSTPLDARAAIELIHGAGGVASLAHPGIEDIDAQIPILADFGLDALELRHPAHDAERVSRYAGLAGLLRLDTSGGADFHSLDGQARPGDHGVGAEAVDRLRARAPRPFSLA